MKCSPLRFCRSRRMSVRSRRTSRRTRSPALRSRRGTRSCLWGPPSLAERSEGRRTSMKVVYSARYHIDIGPHVFPTRKYPLVHARLVENGVIESSDVIEPAPASWDDLSRVHTPEYLSKMREGTLSATEAAQLELPWSAGLVDAFR